MIGTLLVLFTVSWQPSLGATDYVVYCNGASQGVTSATELAVDLPLGQIHQCHVTARNAAGESPPSETVYPYAAALKAPQGTPRDAARQARDQLMRYLWFQPIASPRHLESRCIRVANEIP